MRIKEFLASSGAQIDEFLDGFFEVKIKEAKHLSPECEQAARWYREYLRGGKMARGGLTRLGYLIGGGKDGKEVTAAAAAVEVCHSFLLIHDDWIDRDLMRRGKPTIHVRYQKAFDELGKGGDSFHWSAGMATNLGDIGYAWSVEILSGVGLPAEKVIAALTSLTKSLVRTGYGQILDLGYDVQPGWDWTKIITVRELKTAYYTLVMPLQVGLSLAGADEKKMKAAESYGRPVGIGFQLHDDYLGLFGDEAKTGKSASSDLKEGKKTLIFAKAFDSLAGKEASELRGYLGRPDLTKAEIDRARVLVRESGAVEFCQQEAKKLVDQGKEAIGQLTDQKEYQEILASLADYLITREK